MSLDFKKVTYVDGETVIGAKNLNDIQDALLDLDDNKVEKEQGKGLSTNDYSDADKSKVDTALQSVPDTYRTAAMQDAIDAAQDERINDKVKKEHGKGLSTEDYTTAEKEKLAGIAQGATAVTVDSTLSVSSNAADAKATGDSISAINAKIPAAASSVNKLMDAAAVNSAIATAISGITGFSYEIVQTLPASGAAGTIYLILQSNGGKAQNIYNEYIWIADKWEMLGTTEVDLSQYRTASAQDIIDAGKQAKITASGILKGDGNGGVTAATAGTDYGTYAKPSAGIPKSDLASAVQTSLGKADTALQQHQSLTPYRTAAAQDEIDDEQDDRIDDLEQATTSTTLGPAPIVTFDASAADMPLKSLTVNIEPVQAAGTPSPENPLPITGWTGANVTKTGKNLLSLSNVELGGTNPRTKSVSIGAIPPGTYYFSAVISGTGTGNFGIQFFNNTTFVGGVYSESQNVTLTDTANRTYAYMSSEDYSDGKTFGLSEIQLELGSTASAYEPYQVNTYPIAFPSEAGTVYGGTLDATNKKLTVNRVLVTLDGSNSAGLTWGTDSADLASIRFDTSFSPYLRMVFDSPLQSNYLTKVAPKSSQPWTIELASTPESANITRMWFKIPLNVFSSQNLNGALAYFTEHPLQICYKLATPIVYDLTDIPEILTLYGTNNIWADCGDVTVTYGAYLETVKKHAEVVGDSILSAIAPLEASYTASRVYTVGSYLFVGTKFYKVTAPIGIGDAINPGTNVTQTTVAAQLMELAEN